MNNQASRKMRQYIKRYLMIALGAVIGGASINAFLVPHHMLSGGVSGVAMILHFLFGWPIGVLVFIMNIPIFYAAYRLLNKEFVICALYGMTLFSVALDVTRFLSDPILIDDILLASIFGGVIAGIGSGIVFRATGSTGGTDIIATIVKKYYGLNIGAVNFAINTVLMVIAGFLFGAKPAMYTLLSMYVSAAVTDKVIEGFNRKKAVMIISDSCDQIAAAILQEIGRGVTFLRGEGAFTHSNKKVIFVVVSLTQIAALKFILDELDPYAFMIIQDAAEVAGRGFTHPLNSGERNQ